MIQLVLHTCVKSCSFRQKMVENGPGLLRGSVVATQLPFLTENVSQLSSSFRLEKVGPPVGQMNECHQGRWSTSDNKQKYEEIKAVNKFYFYL